jgi:flagellar basal-body rod modification protein FlgD
VQLATFSVVEQQVRTNDMLGNLSSQFGVMGMSQLAAWVGQEARAAGPVFLGTQSVTVSYNSPAGADRAELVARDRNGNLVGRETVPLGSGPYQWQGQDLQGNLLPQGVYNLSLESYRGGQQIGLPTQVESYARILEARSGASGTVLVLQGGIEVAATSVTALRMAGSGNVGTLPPQDVPTTPVGGQTGDSSASAPSYDDIWGTVTSFGQDSAPITSDNVTQPEPETYRPE